MFHVEKSEASPRSEKVETRRFSQSLVTVADPLSPAAEAYRTLRTNLLYAFVDDPPRVIVLTSAGSKEGKSTTCANLGVALAQADKNTLVIDCDLRRPKMHLAFGARNFRGLVDVIAGESDMREAWQEPLPNLKLLTSGTVPPNPAELLGSRRFADFLRGVREVFDYILIDSPPIGAVSDPIILSTQGDAVLLVVDAQRTRKSALRQSLRSLEAVEANVIGTVMNRTEASKTGYGSYQAY